MERGHDVHWIMPEFHNISGVKVYPVNPRASKLSPMFKAIMIRRLVKKISPDIVHVHGAIPFGLYGALSGFHPFIVSPLGSDILIFPNSKISKRVVQFVLSKADLITCDADHIKELLRGLGAEYQKIELVCFGVDTHKFKPTQKSNDIRDDLGASDSLMVISLRNLEPIYNIESLITSSPLILKEFPEVKIVIAGGGSQESELKELVNSLGVSANTVFVGWIPNNKLPQYIASADIYVSTSLSDAGLAVSTAEAMACGLPAVVTDFGDNKKWVEDGVCGFVVPLSDPEALAEKIVYLLKHDDIRKEFGMRGRKVIEERNDYYEEMAKMENIYMDIVKRYTS